MASTPNILSKSKTVNKEINTRIKGAGDVSKKDSNKNLQKPIQNQGRHMNFLLQMVNI